MEPEHAPDDHPTAIVAVREQGLALSLSLTVQAHGWKAVLFDIEEGMDALPLTENATLLIDEQVIPGVPVRSITRLRSRPWKGLVIVLTEDAVVLGRKLAALKSVVVLEKPFGSSDLVAILPKF